MNNDIPQPKFSVGEQVITYSKSFPELSGKIETVVDCYFAKNAEVMTGEKYTGWVYGLEGLTFDACETALRKKHDGSEFTFDQLMSTLKQPCNV